MSATCAIGYRRAREGVALDDIIAPRQDAAMQTTPASPVLTYAITAGVILIVMALRWRKTGRAVPLKLERLWIMPALLGVAVAFTFAQMPPHGRGWLFCLIAAGLGATLGWQRGRMMRIAVDPETHRLSQTSSPAALVLILAVVVLRQAARAGGAAWLHLDAIALSDMLLALAFGLVAAQRLEMFLRGRRLLRAIPR